MPAFNRRRYKPRAKSTVAAPRRRLPPSSALINFVLEHADIRDDVGGGRLLMRVGPDVLADGDLTRSLGAEASRLPEVAVIWDEIDEVVFRVLDGGPPPIALVQPADDDRLELTPAALEYIARSQSTGRS